MSIGKILSIISRKMQIHMIMIYLYTPSKVTKIKILIIPSVGEEVEQLEFSYAARKTWKTV